MIIFGKQDSALQKSLLHPYSPKWKAEGDLGLIGSPFHCTSVLLVLIAIAIISHFDFGAITILSNCSDLTV